MYLASQSPRRRQLLEAAGFSLDEAVMVGDRHFDVEAAHEAGIPCIGVYYGDTAPAGELEKAGAASIAHTVDELRRLFLA